MQEQIDSTLHDTYSMSMCVPSKKIRCKLLRKMRQNLRWTYKGNYVRRVADSLLPTNLYI